VSRSTIAWVAAVWIPLGTACLPHPVELVGPELPEATARSAEAPPNPRELLLGALTDGEPLVRGDAIGALVRTEPAATAEALAIVGLNSPEDAPRLLTIAALQQRLPDLFAERLLRATVVGERGEPAWIRSHAALALTSRNAVAQADWLAGATPAEPGNGGEIGLSVARVRARVPDAAIGLKRRLPELTLPSSTALLRSLGEVPGLPLGVALERAEPEARQSLYCAMALSGDRTAAARALREARAKGADGRIDAAADWLECPASQTDWVLRKLHTPLGSMGLVLRGTRPVSDAIRALNDDTWPEAALALAVRPDPDGHAALRAWMTQRSEFEQYAVARMLVGHALPDDRALLNTLVADPDVDMARVAAAALVLLGG
jgi:hypothetical protein